MTEQHTACGMDVWSNEYQILAGYYEGFQDAIDAGLARAAHAIFFANDRWAAAVFGGLPDGAGPV